ncbi:MAG: hypothetical protein PVJ57_11195 [Phycisphaerae bacterium]|jgi:hypothetical protein
MISLSDRRRFWKLTVAMLSLAGLLGCSTAFHERYYVGVYERDATKGSESEGGPAQFYRYTIDGATSLFNKTRYEAGWYDAAVVDKLFGEVRPGSAKVASRQTAGTAPLITDIPLLFAGGKTGRVDASEQPDLAGTAKAKEWAVVNAEATAARLRSSAGPWSIPLENLTRVRCAKATFHFRRGDSSAGESPPRILVDRIELHGAGYATLANGEGFLPTTEDASGFFGDIIPGADAGRFSAGLLDSLWVAGARTTVVGQMARGSGDDWSGPAAYGESNSQFHHAEWGQHEAKIVDGAVESGGAAGRIVAVDSHGHFTDVHGFSATAGWLAQAVAARLTLEGVQVTWPTETNETWVLVLSDGQVTTSFDFTTDDASSRRLTEYKNSLKPSTQPVEAIAPLELADVTLTPQDASDKRHVRAVSAETWKNWMANPGQGGNSAPTAAKVVTSEITAEHLAVQSGNIKLTLTTAVEQARQAGNRVVLKGPEQATFYNFGPEGVREAQRENERLVVFMSASPRVLVNHIRALVNARQTQQVVASALLAPRLIEDARRAKESRSAVDEAKALAKEMADYIVSDSFNGADLPTLQQKAIGWLARTGGDNTGMSAWLSVVLDGLRATHGETDHE